MKKIWAITWKELVVTFRDRSALLLMLITPLGLTLIMMFAFGRGDSPLLHEIPVHIVSHDTGEIGKGLIRVFQSDELSALIDLTISTDEASSRAAVNSDKIAALVIVPAGLSAHLVSSASFMPGARKEPITIEIYANPGRTISSSLICGIVERFAATINAGASGAQVSIEQMIASGRASQASWQVIGRRAAQRVVSAAPITLREETAKARPPFDWLGYYAPSMAILFLTFAMSARTRSILTEREMGTLPRLMSTPTTPAQIIAGKIAGAFATGVLQMGILVVTTTLLMGVTWGAALPLSAVILVAVATMTSLGLIIAALSRTASQADHYGMAVLLLFGAISGHFFPRTFFPDWMKTLTYITPNTWCLEAFTRLGRGEGLSSISLHLVVLGGMTVVCFTVSTIAFRRHMR